LVILLAVQVLRGVLQAFPRIQRRAVRPIGNPIAIGIAVGAAAPEPGSRIADARGLKAREGALGSLAVDPPGNVHDGVGGGAGKEADLARGPGACEDVIGNGLDCEVVQV